MNSRILPIFTFALALFALVSGSPAFAAGAIRVSVSPNVLLADGISTAIVTADVRNSSGRPARDGTEVRFYTTAGTITQVAFTSAGVARATLTAASIPQAANISVSVGLDQAVTTVPMVSKVVEASVGGRVLKITGKYVAFSEDKHFIQADQQVKVRYRGLEIEANSVQIDLDRNNIKALGKVNVISDDKTLIGDRLWLDLQTFEGFVIGVGNRKWFSGYGLTELPERPKNLNPDFDLVDLTDSKLLWVSRSANYIAGERVQIQGGRAFVGGIKSIRMPYHEANLKEGINSGGQYIGLGTAGLSLDLPLYLHMSPDSSTALRVGYGTRSGGIGYFTRQQGLSVDLVQKYGFAGKNEGEAMLTNMSSFDRWGFYWNHTQQLTGTTRLVTNLQFPEHRDLYGQMNLTSGLPIGILNLAMSVARPERTGVMAKTLSFSFESKPKPVADGKVALSATTSFYRRDPTVARVLGSSFSNSRSRISIPGAEYQSVGIRARPKTVQLMKGLELDTSTSLQAVTGSGNSAGFGPAFDAQIRKSLPNNGTLSLGINYNRLASINDYLPSQGRLNGTLSASVPVTRRLRLTALGNMALDAESRHSVLQLSYQATKQWRLEMLHTLFQFGQFGDQDYQFGISRPLAGRDIGIYWSRREHKFIIEFGASRF